MLWPAYGMSFLARATDKHEGLAGADHDLVSDVVAIQHGLAVGVEVKSVAEALADFAHRHAAHGQLFSIRPAGDGNGQLAAGRLVEEARGAPGGVVTFMIRLDTFAHSSGGVIVRCDETQTTGAPVAGCGGG